MLKDNKGTALVEFAMLLPVLITLLVGLLSFGLYFGAAHSVQQLAADAARRSVAGDSIASRRTLVSTYVAQNAADYFLITNARLSEVSVSAEADDRLRIRIGYDASWLPIWSFERILPLPPRTITRDCVILQGDA